jgi:hypothetical protein
VIEPQQVENFLQLLIAGLLTGSIYGPMCVSLSVTILPEADWAKAIETAARHGIVPRIEGALDFAGRSRVLLGLR